MLTMNRQADRRTERRSRSAADCGLMVRAGATTDKPPTFFGHAAVTASRTAIGDPLTWGFFEEIASGAFDRTLADPATDARMLIDHNSSLLVSRQSAGDLRLGVDDIGLAVDSDLDQELSYVKDFARNVQARRITGMSFGFYVVADDWTTIDVTATDEAGKQYTVKVDLRTVLDVDLIEVSGVTFPAYTDTDAALRAMRSNPGLLKRREQLLRATGPKAGLDKRLVGRALDLMAELRVGKVLSQQNIDLLQGVLDQLAAADQAFDPLVSVVTSVDAALDAAQADISDLLGVPDPDADDPDEEDEGDGQRSESGKPVPPADYMRAFAIRHGQRFTE